jgi:NAD-dependent dihydropyrimidine dehydrogenase PreA subunit
MKNILILNICNRHDFYGHDVEVIEETWAKDIIDNVYPNISYYSCCGMTPEMVYQTEHKSLGIIDEECHSIFLPINECQVNTYDFFLMLMKTIKPKIYNTDYIMFVNPDVYVNVPLLNDFIQNIINPND